MVRPIQILMPIDATEVAIILELIVAHGNELDLDRAFINTLKKKCDNTYYSLMGRTYTYGEG
jgi:hypothetical protein